MGFFKSLAKKRNTLIATVILVCIVIDQLTKLVAIRLLKGYPAKSYFGDLFRWDYSENPGAFLSLGANLPDGARFWILTVLVGVFLVGLLVYVIRSNEMHTLETLSLALLLGGGISNFFDRALRPNGQVVDFMNLGIGRLRTGIFNVADMAIMAGIGIFLVFLWQGSRHSHPATEPREAPEKP